MKMTQLNWRITALMFILIGFFSIAAQDSVIRKKDIINRILVLKILYV